MSDKIKFVIALLLLVAGVAGFYLLGEYASICRVLSVLAGVVGLCRGGLVHSAWSSFLRISLVRQ
ncbi:MAG: hypothetical protein QM803_08180 [Rhodocyclaceae bacterium]